MILSERCSLAKVRYFQKGKEALVSKQKHFQSAQTLEITTSGGMVSFLSNLKQKWNIFVYSCCQMEKISSVFQDDKLVNLRQCSLDLFCTSEEVPHTLISAMSYSWI